MSAENYVDRVVAPDGVTYSIVDIDAQERIARLEAAYGVYFTEQPSDQTVAAGEKAIFHVAVNNTEVTYQWQVKAIKFSDWRNTDLGGNKTDTLRFNAIAGYNGRKYRCLVTLLSGYQAASAAATLTVTQEEQNLNMSPLQLNGLGDADQPGIEQDENR